MTLAEPARSAGAGARWGAGLWRRLGRVRRMWWAGAKKSHPKTRWLFGSGQWRL